MSKKMAFPATAAGDAEVSPDGASDEELSPPHADSRPALASVVSTIQRRIHHTPQIDVIRTVPTQARYTCFLTSANTIENDSHSQLKGHARRLQRAVGYRAVEQVRPARRVDDREARNFEFDVGKLAGVGGPTAATDVATLSQAWPLRERVLPVSFTVQSNFT